MPTVVLAARLIAADCATVTVADVLERPVALAEMVAVPAAMPVTGTVTLELFAPKLTLAGAVTTPVLLDVMLTVKPPAGAGVERFRARFCTVAALSVTLAGEKLMVVPGPEPVPTVTCVLTDRNPLADAVRSADPVLIPLTTGARFGAIDPSGMKMFTGATITVAGSLLVSVRKTPPPAAGVPSVKRYGTV